MADSEVVLEPPDASALASMLQTANANGQTVLPRGSGTKLMWGPVSTPIDAVLSTRRLATPIDHRPGDLTATIPAGATLAAVNELLGRGGQWLPLDPQVSSEATIGGIVAFNDSGPRRHRHGTPRDLIIGVEMALADGRAAKAGGRVVKNVAGYDLSRLLCGSLGSLAVITSATFKLAPLPPASRTVVTATTNVETLTDLALAIAAAPLAPSALEMEGPPYRLAIRYETTETAAERQAHATCAICDRFNVGTETCDAEREDQLWLTLGSRMQNTGGTLVKMSVLPTLVGETLRTIEHLAAKVEVEYVTIGRVALGVLLVRLGSKPQAHSDIVISLRRDVEAKGGSLVVLHGADALKRQVGTWGNVGSSLPLMRAVKARFDPAGTLSPGRGPGGI
jgi:glycolate oxidase FAD binding subunit